MVESAFGSVERNQMNEKPSVVLIKNHSVIELAPKT